MVANVAALVFAGAIVGTIALETEDESTSTARSEVGVSSDRVRTFYKDRGGSIASTNPAVFFTLEDGAVRKDSVHLSHGGSVAIVGGCDSGCEDLDLMVLDPVGDAVAVDEDSDARPILAFDPKLTGDYTIVTTMRSCATESCRFGYEVMHSEFTLPENTQATGTGFAIDSRGRIMTANHVVEGAESITVVLSDGRELNAVVERQSPANDLAILRVSENTDIFLPLEESSTIAVGQEVFVVGFPLPDIMGEEIKFTSGSVTALSGLRGDAGQLQFSAPIQPGNSGGPVVAENGHVIGIVTSKATEEGTQLVNWATKAAIAGALVGPEKETWTAASRQDAIDRALAATVRVVVR